MALMAKNKPTKKIPFGENNEDFVVLQYLSKGVKDSYNSQLAELSLSLKGVDAAALEKMDVSSLPESMAKVVGRISELEYYKLAHAIKSWSAEEEVSEEAVKGLDEEVFNKLVQEVNKMNDLGETERKN
jgi:hypothetical protein